jgi:hypothetical protein
MNECTAISERAALGLDTRRIAAEPALDGHLTAHVGTDAKPGDWAAPACAQG